MRVLVLEDSDERMEWLRKSFPDWHVERFWTPEGFLRTLLNPEEKWDLLILDHDLGDFLDGVKRTGMDVVEHIPAHSHVLVWSHNIIEMRRMCTALAEREVHVTGSPFSANESGLYTLKVIEEEIREE